ncbi:MAG: MBL fold metallo-hydrolase [bacterium]|nr:MBL fold metallo-hydrolase [bacterium]
MFLTGFAVGPFAANCYLLGCEKTRRLAVIDPGGDARRILETVDRSSFTVSSILNTHGHIDHVAANEEIRKATGAPILIATPDAPMLASPARQLAGMLLKGVAGVTADRLLEDGESIEVGELKLKVLLTPGHTPGSACFLLKGEGLVFSGDTLFEESVGRTDLPGGSWADMIASIREKLLVLDDKVRVLPGHGPETTIGHERRANPFL